MRWLGLIIFIFFILPDSNAQLKFPKGTELNLITDTNYVYFETEIRFYTGEYRLDEYKWIKVYDSLHPAWTFLGCMNGDCFSNLPDSGFFVSAYGLNDTTGFIRCHIDFGHTNGTSMFQYKVINSKLFSDQSVLTFRISYQNPVSVKENIVTDKDFLKVFPEPAGSLRICLKNSLLNQTINVLNVYGQSMFSQPVNEEETIINQLPAGIYLIRVDNYCVRAVIY